MSADLTSIVQIFALAAQTCAVVWWASKLTANQQSLKEIALETKKDLKDHTEDDKEFQLEVTEKLGSIRPTVGRFPNGGH